MRPPYATSAGPRGHRQPAGSATAAPPPPAPPPVTLPPVGGDARPPVLVSGAGDGKVYVYARGSDGEPRCTPASSFQPFAGFTGAIRSAVGDFDGDGIADFAFTTSAGTALRCASSTGERRRHPLLRLRPGRLRRRCVHRGRRPRSRWQGRTRCFGRCGRPAGRRGLPARERELVTITSFVPILPYASAASAWRWAISITMARPIWSSAPGPGGRRECGSTMAPRWQPATVQIVPGFLAYAWPSGTE